jgi:hypothetical protein
MPTLAAGLSLLEYARSLVRRLTGLTAVLLVAIWAMDGRGLFWSTSPPVGHGASPPVRCAESPRSGR